MLRKWFLWISYGTIRELNHILGNTEKTEQKLFVDREQDVYVWVSFDTQQHGQTEKFQRYGYNILPHPSDLGPSQSGRL